MNDDALDSLLGEFEDPVEYEPIRRENTMPGPRPDSEVIIAFANGAALEVRRHYVNGHEGKWEPWDGSGPYFNSWMYEYRVKSLPVTKKRKKPV